MRSRPTCTLRHLRPRHSHDRLLPTLGDRYLLRVARAVGLRDGILQFLRMHLPSSRKIARSPLFKPRSARRPHLGARRAVDSQDRLRECSYRWNLHDGQRPLMAPRDPGDPIIAERALPQVPRLSRPDRGVRE